MIAPAAGFIITLVFASPADDTGVLVERVVRTPQACYDTMIVQATIHIPAGLYLAFENCKPRE